MAFYLQVRDTFRLETSKGMKTFVEGELLTIKEFSKQPFPKPFSGVIDRRFNIVISSKHNTVKTFGVRRINTSAPYKRLKPTTVTPDKTAAFAFAKEVIVQRLSVN